MAMHQEADLTRQNLTMWTPDLSLAASKFVMNQFLVYKPPSLWHFVTAAHTDQDPNHNLNTLY